MGDSMPGTTVATGRDGVFVDVERLWRSGDWPAFDARVEEIHLAYHDDGPVHMRVHAWRMRRALRQGRWFRVGIELLGIPFVVPTSLAQRYLGLALPSRRRGTTR
ncbi:hypothetical protein K2X89_16875 [Myxococcota bacterium]|nr:hypothetical protein [Myxococcota bacterium]